MNDRKRHYLRQSDDDYKKLLLDQIKIYQENKKQIDNLKQSLKEYERIVSKVEGLQKEQKNIEKILIGSLTKIQKTIETVDGYVLEVKEVPRYSKPSASYLPLYKFLHGKVNDKLQKAADTLYQQQIDAKTAETIKVLSLTKEGLLREFSLINKIKGIVIKVMDMFKNLPMIANKLQRDVKEFQKKYPKGKGKTNQSLNSIRRIVREQIRKQLREDD